MKIFEIIRLITSIVTMVLVFSNIMNKNMSRTETIIANYFEGLFTGMTIMGLLASFLIY